MIDGTRTVDSRLNTAHSRKSPWNAWNWYWTGVQQLYGADAVAGVVNLIPVKEYDGFRAPQLLSASGRRQANEEMRYQRPVWGRSFDNGLNYVGAFETYLRTPLMWYERGREHNVSQGTSSSGNPGTFKQVVGADEELGSRYACTAVTLTGARLLDPVLWHFQPGRADPWLWA